MRSAMPTFMALQRCPNLIILPTRFDVYRKVSAVIREILHRFTPLVEPLSLDEAYLDVTAHPGAPAPLAQVIRGLIFRKTKLTASAGIGPNKLIAKIASDLKKPNGQFEVKPEAVPAFMRNCRCGSLGDRRGHRAKTGAAWDNDMRRDAEIVARRVPGSSRQIWDRTLRSLPRHRPTAG